MTLPDPRVTHKWQGKPSFCRYVGGCVTYASFGLPGTKARRYCAKHKGIEMVSINLAYRQKCEREGCTKYPSFGEAGTRKRQYCAKHKESEMVCLK